MLLAPQNTLPECSCYGSPKNCLNKHRITKYSVGRIERFFSLGRLWASHFSRDLTDISGTLAPTIRVVKEIDVFLDVIGPLFEIIGFPFVAFCLEKIAAVDVQRTR